MTTEVALPVRAPSGAVVGCLHIACKPNEKIWHGKPLLTEDSDDPVEAPVQLIEEAEYLYWVTEITGDLTLGPWPIFDASRAGGSEGRLKPGRFTGTVTAEVRQDGVLIGTADFEVRPRKLHYRTEYRAMLNRIAEEGAEALQASFAPATLRAFDVHSAGEARSLYQRFAFVHSFVSSPDFEAALETVLRRPHQEYRLTHEETTGGAGLRADRHLVRQLLAPGPRQALAGGRTIAGLSSLPTRLVRVEHIETYDTRPNQFVKFALEHWRNVAETVQAALSREVGRAGARGQREAEELATMLDDALRSALFAEVGVLESLPSSSTVLQGRAGYRDIYRAFLRSEAAARLAWAGGADVFSAGQRDVALLYEYWCFIEFVRIIQELPSIDVAVQDLFRTSDGNQLELVLSRGEDSVVRGQGSRRGRPVELELWFNRQFVRGDGPDSTWSVGMRPDSSLCVRVGDPGGMATAWLHFDAKYRLNQSEPVFGESAGEAALIRGTTSALTEDLAKMHSYRDAIRRSAGAFVLYPGLGDAQAPRRKYRHEVLPGLGAFVLRPGSDGRAIEAGAQALRDFIEDVIDHLSAAGTDFGRAQYWTAKTYDERGGRRITSPPMGQPAADTTVLLGFVHGPAHRRWVLANRLYNLRADERRGSVQFNSPELAADLVLLYDEEGAELSLFPTTGAFEIRTGDQLTELGYRSPGGGLYCCLRLGDEMPVQPAVTSSDAVRHLAMSRNAGGAKGAPVLVRWLDVAGIS